jgi:DNA-directed RNA polymerase subunit RPC12/RpoP
MSDNGTGWICARCGKEQKEPKSHHSVKRCEPCRPLAKKEQTAAYQKAHLADLRGARPDLAFQRKKARG